MVEFIDLSTIMMKEIVAFGEENEAEDACIHEETSVPNPSYVTFNSLQ